MGTTATATIGGVAFDVRAAEEDANLPEWAQDVGFKYFGVSPPAPNGESGWYDVEMTLPPKNGKGESVTRVLQEAWYYAACPETVHIDRLGFPTVDETGDTAGPVPDAVAPGTVVPVVGCGFNTAEVRVELLNADGTVAAPVPMVQTCSTAQADLTIPALPDGVYYLVMTHNDGTQTGISCASDTGTDSDGDTAAVCSYTTPVAIEGATP